jgi:hypothetical protein
MVSEDSDQLMPRLFSVHRLSDFGDTRKTRMGQMGTAIDQSDAASKLLKVSLLC